MQGDQDVANRNVNSIIELCKGLEQFWRAADGWAPPTAAQLLTSARLDRQTSFAKTLRDCLKPFPEDEREARQILGYATLRSMCEGALKLFLGVYVNDYFADPQAFLRKGAIAPPETLSFDQLITFYESRVDRKYNSFLRRVQKRGNAIHHFVDRQIGKQEDLQADISVLLQFLLSVNSRLPYPDTVYNPGQGLVFDPL